MSESNRVDFHVHYTDATAPSIIHEARDNGIVVLGLIGRAEISDKINDYVREGEQLGIEVFPGVECLSRIDGKFVDLIAIGVDENDSTIRRYFGQNDGIELNSRIAQHQYGFLQGQGFSFTDLSEDSRTLLNELLAGRITEKAIKFCQIAVSNAENDLLIGGLKNEFSNEWQEVHDQFSNKPGYNEHPLWVTAKFLYQHYFAPGCPGYVLIQPTSTDFINAAHQAGGVIVYSPEGDFNAGVWQTLVSQGVDGIMAWHGGDMEIAPEIASEAHRTGLLVLGGSDYNPDNNHWQMGNGKGDMYISPRRAKDLKKRLAAIRSGALRS